MKPTRPIARSAVAAATLLAFFAAGCDSEPYAAGSVDNGAQANAADDPGSADSGGEGADDDGANTEPDDADDGAGGDGDSGDGDSGDGAGNAELTGELEAAANGFYDALTQAYAELDPAAIEAVSAQDCQTCRTYAASVADVAESGQEFAETGSYELSDVAVVETSSDDTDTASLTFDRRHTGLTIVDGTGATVQESEDETVRVQLRFREVDGQWLVLEELYLS